MRWTEPNTWASFGGMVGTALIFFVSLALYVRFFSSFEFACIGLFLTLCAIALALDGGAAQTVNRELAANSASEHGRTRLQACFLQLLKYCLLLTTCLALILFFLLPWIASYWLRIETTQLDTLHKISPWMVLACALQIPIAFYSQAMQGLSLHIMCNSINLIFLSLRFFGAVYLVQIISSDRMVFFFAWHLALSLIHLITMQLALWTQLQHYKDQVDDPDLWPRVKPFMGDIAALSIITIVITQIDKVIVSRLVSFDQYGYYVMVASLASVLVRLVQPLFALTYPRMTQAVAKKDINQLRQIYVQSTKATVVVLAMAVLPFVILASPIISWYSQKPDLIHVLALPLQLLAVGYAANAIMLMPFALTLAHGWARFSLIQNIVAALGLIPVIWVGTNLWGIRGAALGWCLVNLAYLLISLPIIQRYCLSIPRKPIKFLS
jgi:O-antigen/teichoic acid export membrane protein